MVDGMDDYLDIAMATNLDAPVRATHAAAVGTAFTQAQTILGEQAPAGEPTAAEAWNTAVQILAFRIEYAAGLDAFGSVLGLRRWGVTWDVIGRATGISRQAAHARWGAQVHATLDRYGTGELGGPVADDEADLTS